ncbi:MAG: hypothetical protein ABJQ29_13395 [Luteolibacter sp.]
MSGESNPEKNTAPHDDRVTEEDIHRAEKSTGAKAPLESSEEDAYVPDTELRAADGDAEEKSENDPTAGKSATS